MTDAVLPLSILNIAQAESVLNGFAMNLILTSVLAVVLIGAAGLTRRGNGKMLAACVGVAMVLLPLCGGSGLVMLPPLGFWLAGYVARGWWSGARPGPAARAIGLGFLVASAVVVALYFRGYVRPPHHPATSSTGAAISSTFMYLSLAIFPRLGSSYWPPAGWVLFMTVGATLWLLASAGYRSPQERPRALGLIAIILAMICVAIAVGVSRAGLGPVAILSSRYVTLTTPMLCAMYMAWIIYGRDRARRGVHLGLATMIGLTIPGGLHFSRDYGSHVRHVELRVERCLLAGGSTEVLMDRACPALFTDRKIVYDLFKMLKAARVGAFARFEEPRVASTPDDRGGTARR